MNVYIFAFLCQIVQIAAVEVSLNSQIVQDGRFEYPHPTVRYASSITPNPQPTYADSASMKKILTGATYTTWASVPSPTDHGKYGNSAWSALWATIPAMPSPPYTTTVSPTPIPSSELIFPPQYNDSCSVKPEGQKLPADFIWGLAGSAIQVEGANKNEGRGPSNLDASYAESPLSDLNYYLYKQDIARLAAIGVPHYSFSISWSRILPFGVPGSPINQQAIDHYNDVINTCLEYGIIPIVTMCHFDPPTVFGTAKHYPTYGLNQVANIGLNNNTIVPAFVHYARILFSHYADRVPYWITFNEPEYVASSYLGVKNVIKLHSETVQIYRDELCGTGKLSIKNVHTIGVPLNASDPEDVKAANRYNDFGLGPISYPIAFGKDYPQSIRDTFGSQLENYTKEELALAKGSCDFYSIDAYSGFYIKAPPNGLEACVNDPSDPDFPTCAIASPTGFSRWDNGFLSEQDVLTVRFSFENSRYSCPNQPTHSRGGSYKLLYKPTDNLKAAPTSLRTVLKYIWKTYSPSGILISEYGFPVSFESQKSLAAARFDIDRSTYYESYNMEILKSIHEDGVNVIGAIGWGFLDDWELGDLELRFGLQYVNFTTLERFYKSSLFTLVGFYDRYISE